MPVGKDSGGTKKPEMYIFGLTERVDRLEQKVDRLIRQAEKGKIEARDAAARPAPIE